MFNAFEVRYGFSSLDASDGGSPLTPMETVPAIGWYTLANTRDTRSRSGESASCRKSGSFFKKLSAWIYDKYFIKNAKKVRMPKSIGFELLIDSENDIIARPHD